MDEYFDRVQRQMEEAQRLLEGPMRALQKNQPAIERAMRGITDSGVVRELLSARLLLPHWTDQLSKNADVVTSAFATLTAPPVLAGMASFIKEQQRYAAKWQRLLESFPSVTEGLRAHIGSASLYALAANNALKTIDLDVLGPAFGVAIPEWSRLERTTLALSNHYSSMASSLSSTAGLATAFPPFVCEMPSIGIFVHSEAVRNVTPHQSYDDGEQARSLELRVEVADETDAFLEGTLVQLKPAFLDQLHGFLTRAAQRGPDWWGQAAESARKLLLGVLHTVAPNARVLPWVTNSKKQLDRNGHPTRATKVAWLCQFIPNESYRKFVRTDIDSALALIDLFHSAVHVDEFPEFEQTFSWTTLRLKVALRHILAIWKDRQEGN